MAVAEREIAVKHGIVVLQDVSFTSSARPSGDASRPSIRSERDGRVRIDAGTLLTWGASLLAPAATGADCGNPQPGCTPTNFYSNPRTSPCVLESVPGLHGNRGYFVRKYLLFLQKLRGLLAFSLHRVARHIWVIVGESAHWVPFPRPNMNLVELGQTVTIGGAVKIHHMALQ